MKNRPDGSPSALSRRLGHARRPLKAYGTAPVGDVLAIDVSLQEGKEGPFVDVRLTFAGHPTRRGIALLPEEVASVAAFLSRAASDIAQGKAAARP